MEPAQTLTPTTATPITIEKNNNPPQAQAQARVCCFSFAAYAKALIRHLRFHGVPVLPGLSDAEFSALESSLRLSFPPDLRSILREGVPSSPGFPNWRRSPSSLRHLLRLPLLSLQPISALRPRPTGPLQAHDNPLDSAPPLIPVYRHFYIPATADSAAGDPVFSVLRGDVELVGFDLAGFFQRLLKNFPAPAWAAKEARRVDVWTELAGRSHRRRVAVTRGGWWGGDALGWCLEEVVWRLREGGWREEEVREMLMMDGGDGFDGRDVASGDDWARHVRQLSLTLLRAGWSAEDVAYSLGFKVGSGYLARAEPRLDFQRQDSCCREVS